MFNNLWLFWDVESTSARPTEDDIISIGAILATYKNGFQEMSRFHTYVNTSKQISPEAESVHHISHDKLKGEPKFPEAINKLRTWLLSYINQGSRLIFVAHNGTKFDNIILFCNFVQNRLNYDEFLSDIKCYGFLDTLKMLRTLFKKEAQCNQPKKKDTGQISYALGVCYETFCCSPVPNDAHDALVDSYLLLSVYNSPHVTAKIDLNILFNFVETREKQVKMIKQAAGNSFKKMEEFVRNEQLPPVELNFSKSDPMWNDGSTNGKQLCLLCMQFYCPQEHKVCLKDGLLVL